MKIKCQVSIELLALIGFVLVVFIPILFFAYTKSNELHKNGEEIYTSAVINRLASTISTIYHSGDKSKINMVITVPPSTKSIYFEQNGNITEIIGESNDGNQIVAIAEGPVEDNKNLTPGTYTLLIKNEDGIIKVEITNASS